ncbi:hypothetical protein GIB67_030852 [Kingdonia uniflora]|uniref:Uncharacterized protein n=1 Tax=Kingdonia uniflora TaxID=39325 RepID=A0A7J7L3F1_9MAGN|nr:hypothetical protein GIB67_030852 [Kingdonia uniflora]
MVLDLAPIPQLILASTSDNATEFAKSIRGLHTKVRRHLEVYAGVKERVDTIDTMLLSNLGILIGENAYEIDITVSLSKVVYVKLLSHYHRQEALPLPVSPIVSPIPGIHIREDIDEIRGLMSRGVENSLYVHDFFIKTKEICKNVVAAKSGCLKSVNRVLKSWEEAMEAKDTFSPFDISDFVADYVKKNKKDLERFALLVCGIVNQELTICKVTNYSKLELGQFVCGGSGRPFCLDFLLGRIRSDNMLNADMSFRKVQELCFDSLTLASLMDPHTGPNFTVHPVNLEGKYCNLETILCKKPNEYFFDECLHISHVLISGMHDLGVEIGFRKSSIKCISIRQRMYDFVLLSNPPHID